MAPSSYHAMDALGRTGGAGTMLTPSAGGVREPQSALSDFVPDSRKRKIEEVDGHQQDERSRLGMQFNHEGGSSISPSSYRTYSDFPRSSYPPQMPAPATTGHLGRPRCLDDEEPPIVVKTVVAGHVLERSMNDAALSSADRMIEEDSGGYGRQPIPDRVGHFPSHTDWSQRIGECGHLVSRDRSRC
jgi:hypothetical protein